MTPYKLLNTKIRQLLSRYENGELSIQEYEIGLKALYEEHLVIDGEELEKNESKLLNFLLLANS